LANRPGDPKQKLLIILIVISSFILIPGIIYFKDAFSEIHIDFNIDREESETLGHRFITNLTPIPEDYISVTVFDYDDTAKTFLELELGLIETRKYTGSVIDVWGWRTQWFKPLEKEKFTCQFSPSGNLIEYSRTILEDAQGEMIPDPAAETIAREFAESHFGDRMSEYILVKSKDVERPNRLDREYIYEKAGFDIHDAKVRISIVVAGDQVIHAHKYLKVPETWERDFDRMRNTNMRYQNFGTLGAFILIVGALISIFRKLRLSKLAWRTALFTGFIVGFVYALNSWNLFPVIIMGYDTTLSMGSFIMDLIMGSLASAAGTTFLLLLFISIGEFLYRESYPDKLRFTQLMKYRTWRTRECFQSVLVGYALVMFHVGFVVLFYVFGKKLGVWAPAEVNYSNAISAVFPIFLPLSISLWAAFVEESIFRMFAIPFLKRLTKSTFLAVCLPAFIWGFLHSAYPQQPGFIRGLEVGLIGVVAGFVMLRFGILATLLWHFIMDSIFIGLFMFESGQTDLIITGCILCVVLVLPLGFVLISRWKTGKFLDSEFLLNKHTPVDKRPEVIKEKIVRTVHMLPGLKPLQRLICFLIIAGGCLALFFLPDPRLGSKIRLQTTLQQAGDRSDIALQKLGADPSQYRRAVYFQSPYWTHGLKYIREMSSLGRAENVYSESRGKAAWHIRYFRVLEKDEYIIAVSPDGNITSTARELPETASGAALPQEDAQKLAENLLKKFHVDTTILKDIETTQVERENRTDYELTYEILDGEYGDAQKRAKITVIGDKAFGPRRWIKPPEKWVLEQEEQSKATWKKLITILKFAALSLIAVWIILTFFKLFRENDFSWIPGRNFAFLATVAYGIDFINRSPALFSSYSSTETLTDFILKTTITELFVVLALCLALIFLGSFITIALRRLSLVCLQSISSMRDTFWGILSLSVGFAGLQRISEWIYTHNHLDLIDYPTAKFSGFNSTVPAISLIAQTAISSVLIGCVILALFIIFTRLLDKPLILSLMFLAAAYMASVSSIRNPGDWWIALIPEVIFFGGMATIVYFLRNVSPRIYFWALFAGGVVMKSIPYIQSESAWYQVNGVFAVCTALVLTWHFNQKGIKTASRRSSVQPQK